MASVKTVLDFSVIKLPTTSKGEAPVYDCVPTSWNFEEFKCYYPTTTNKKTVMQMVKRCDKADPKSADWKILDNVIVQSTGYESFNKGWENAIRLSTGRQTASASELEIVKPRKRTQKNKDLPESNVKKSKISHPVDTETDDSSFEEESDNDVSGHKKTESFPNEKNGVDQVLAVDNPREEPVFVDKENSSEKDENQGQKVHVDCSCGEIENEGFCDINKRFPHICAFDGNKVTFVTLARSLCHLSRSMEKLQLDYSLDRREVSSSLEQIIKRPIIIDAVQGLVAEENEILDYLPFVDIRDVMEFDNKLADKEFSDLALKILKDKVPHNILCKTARGLVDLAFSQSLQSQFSWAGQKKLNIRKHAFLKTRFFDKIVLPICSNIHGSNKILERVKSTLKSHFSSNADDGDSECSLNKSGNEEISQEKSQEKSLEKSQEKSLEKSQEKSLNKSQEKSQEKSTTAKSASASTSQDKPGPQT